ncbi:Prominin-like protein [Caenorhabditis elegans]|uniref:Prominin-like protein n=1 Tax=Caenorhabditis elegans TaxID=6239 RepID=Q21571_CAEEL|nr:Prominin-like protein [Caenorhabditis elegans]CAA90129.2 Prominin-like protein [Caenorhabditis elegans]
MKLRLFVGFIALISIAFCAKSPKPQASGPAPAQCPKSSVEVKPMKPELTGSVGFYGTGKGISDSLQKTPDSKSYEDLNNLISGKESYGETLKSMILSQVTAIVFWSVGIVLIIIAAALCIVTCIWQCCSTCAPRESAVRSEYTGMVYLALLATTLAFTLAGVIIFNLAETDFVDTVDNGVKYANQLTSDMSNVFSNGKNQLTCEVKSSTSQAFAEIRSFIRNYERDVTDKAATQVGLTAVNKFDVDAFVKSTSDTVEKGEKLNAALANINNPSSECKTSANELKARVSAMGIALKGLSTAADTVMGSSELDSVNKMVDVIKAEIKSQSRGAGSVIDSAQKSIDDTTNSIVEFLDQVQHQVEEIKKSIPKYHEQIAGYNSFSTVLGIRLGIIIPAAMGCIYCIVAIVAVILSLIKQDGVALKLSRFVIDGFFSSITGSITLLGFAMFAFALGLVVSSICVPVFEDDNYTLFRQMNVPMPAADNKTKTSINIDQLLESCNNPSMTLYKAIDGKKLISEEAMNKQINLNKYRDMADKKISEQPKSDFKLPQATNYKNHMKAVNDNAKKAQSADLSKCKDADLNKQFKEYAASLKKSQALSKQFIDNLAKLAENAPKTSTIVKDLNKNYFTKKEAVLKQAVTKLLKALQDDIFKCRPLVDIYNNAGVLVCEQVGLPIHGLWASIGLGGVAMFFQIIVLLLTFRWLSTHSKKSAGKSDKMLKSKESKEKEEKSENKDKKKKKKKSKKDKEEEGSAEKADGDANKNPQDPAAPGEIGRNGSAEAGSQPTSVEGKSDAAEGASPMAPGNGKKSAVNTLDVEPKS